MGHRGQIFKKTASEDERSNLEQLLEATECDESYVAPATERDEQDRRVSATFHLDATEREEALDSWAVFGVSAAVMHRLAWRIGAEVIRDAMIELELLDGDE